MKYKVLYRKYRPTNFDDLIGQDYTKKMLMNVISSGKVGHAYIFTGPRGTGKTSSAKLFAKSINCLDSRNGNPCDKCENCLNFSSTTDIIEIDAASNNGVEEMRELIDNVKLSPSSLKYKVYIIDEVHMLSASSFNALLLTLEEPPAHAVFILATTDIQSVPITILSRCQRFDFKPIDNDNICKRLLDISNMENIDITEEALREIAYIAAGGMRDALSILDQLAANNVKIDVDEVISNFGTISNERVLSLIDMFLTNDATGVLEFLKEVRIKGVYYSVFLEKLINSFRDKAVEIKLGSYDYNFDKIYNIILDLNNCLATTNININPYLLIEMIFLKYLDNSSKKEHESKVIEEVVVEKIIVEEISNDITTENKDVTLEVVDNTSLNDDDVVENIDIKDDLDNFKKIRINNCFCEVSKDVKNEIVDKWNDFIEYLVDEDKYVMSLVVDASVEAASKNYVIISTKANSTSELINNEIHKIEGLFNNKFNNTLKFIAVSSDEWNLVKNEYISNLKNGYKYTVIDEEFEEELLEESDELEKIAFEIFGSDNIEFK